jgi:ActR/RegA family two-component response regulator
MTNGTEILNALVTAGIIKGGEAVDMPAILTNLQYALIDRSLALTVNAKGEQNNSAAAAHLNINRTTLIEQLKRRQK